MRVLNDSADYYRFFDATPLSQRRRENEFAQLTDEETAAAEAAYAATFGDERWDARDAAASTELARKTLEECEALRCRWRAIRVSHRNARKACPNPPASGALPARYFDTHRSAAAIRAGGHACRINMPDTRDCELPITRLTSKNACKRGAVHT